jgi:MFS family permease
MTMHSSSLSPPSARRGTSGHNNRTSLDDEVQRWKHLYVLPVLLLEFLALALTRAVLPALLLAHFGSRRVYLVMGAVDCVRGLLAFGASPIFGKLSDVVGRKLCLLVTVLGTCAPVCSLAFFSWEVAAGGDSVTSGSSSSGDYLETVGGQSANALEETSDASGFWPSLWDSAAGEATAGTPIVPPGAIPLFVVLLALSGMFSSTFTLVFAYISDTVPHQDERVSAYGLALATFGLSFTIGPMIGGYLAQSHPQYVFLTSLLLTIVDLLYVYFILPESRQLDHEGSFESSVSVMSKDATFSWNPIKSLRLVAVDPFLRKVGEVAFLYYTGLWALISTLSVYAVQRFHLGPERLGELMSALGLCTMVAEAVLVRIMVPLLGEKRSIQIGLVSFGLQCIVLGFAYEPWHLFVGAAFSLLGNLVYPSLSSLVSGSVEPDAVGEALGAMNGIKALTEGIGPLLFGSLMTLSEHSTLPGWPYLVAAVLVLAAYRSAQDLPDLEEDDYIHEVDKRRPRRRRPTGSRRTAGDIMMTHTARDDSEYGELLSEIESDEDDAADVPSTPPRQGVDL